MTVHTSVIVVTCDHLDVTVRCMESLLRTLPRDAELILVDNGSTDGTPAYLTDVARRLGPRASTLFLQENLGYVGAANAGMRAAKGRVFALVDNDVLVTPGWLDGLLECLEDAPRVVPGAGRVGLVGPTTNQCRGPQRLADAPSLSPAALDDYAEQHREAFRRRWSTTFFLSSFCLLVRRDVIDAIGMFDERFFPSGYHDDDLALRAAEAGFSSVIAGDVFVFHEGAVTMSVLFPEAARSNVGLFFDAWRARRAGKTRLVATYRVHNAATTIVDSLNATARFADAIVVVDCASTDETARIAAEHPAVTRLIRSADPPDGARDRNLAHELAAALAPDWIVAVEGDEVFEMDRPRAERLMRLADPHAASLAFQWYALWDPARTYYRTDGVFGAMTGYRMYRFRPGLVFSGVADRGFFRDGVPDLPEGSGRFTNVRVKQLGFETEELRRARVLRGGRSVAEARERTALLESTITLRRYAPAGVSLCVITKNEARRLERFLAFFEPIVDEIIVVDNGSDDASFDIARKLTDKVVVHRTSRLDLAEVRNVGLAMATRPWILSMDPDEEISHWDLPRLVRLQDDPDVHAYSFEIANHQKDGPPVMTLSVRMFRNDPRIRYGRAVHETVQQSLEAHPELTVRPAGVPIQHHGFLKDDDVVESKLALYLEANQRLREEDPTDPLPWYNEALHLVNEGRDEEAILFLERAILLGPHFLSPRSSLAQIYQHRALALWQSMLAELPPNHPVRPSAEDSMGSLARITPPRPVVGIGRKKRYPGPSYGQ